MFAIHLDLEEQDSCGYLWPLLAVRTKVRL